VPVAALIGSQRCFVLRQSSIPHQCQRPVLFPLFPGQAGFRTRIQFGALSTRSTIVELVSGLFTSFGQL